MADPEHLRILEQGVAAWNVWREENPEVTPDLIKADLRQADLRGANLAGAVIGFADLEQADLAGADLQAAKLIGAKLMAADLSRANLKNAILGGADLTGANLREALLLRTNLGHANLSGCDLSGALLEYTYLSEANLQGANLSSSILDQTDLSRTNLQKADFSNTKLNRTNLAGANLQGVGLSREFSKAELRGRIDFTGANLSAAELWECDLRGNNFSGADLSGAYLGGADLGEANLSGADLRGTHLDKARLERADLSGADLRGADLRDAYLTKADLSDALLAGANLEGAQLIESNIAGTDISKTRIYGISVWNVRGVPDDQAGLVITPNSEASVTVDDLEVAQFIYLLLRREKLRNVIDTITSKAVLILGRFTPERKVILDAMADELRRYNLLPIIFDFERSTARDFTETIKTLASLSFFVIADITNPKSAPLELQATIPDYQIPFVPIIQQGEKPFSMFSDLAGKYDWVLRPVAEYPSLDHLLQKFKKVIIDRAWEKHQELQRKRAGEIGVLSVDKFLE